MKYLLKSEELLQFVAAIWLFSRLDFAWWIFPALLFVPDVSMLGYLVSPRLGAITYNILEGVKEDDEQVNGTAGKPFPVGSGTSLPDTASG